MTDRIGLADGEVDYKHFRLLGNRDYEAKPQRCVTFAPDGVTFTVDVSASDLVLEAELTRIAERVDGEGARAASTGSRRRPPGPSATRGSR